MSSQEEVKRGENTGRPEGVVYVDGCVLCIDPGQCVVCIGKAVCQIHEDVCEYHKCI